MSTGWLRAWLCQPSVLLSAVPWLLLCWLGSSGFKAEETVAEGGQFPAREAAAGGRESGQRTEGATGALEGSFAP